MKKHLQHSRLLFRRLGLLLALYLGFRILFILLNAEYFNDIGFGVFWGGFWFDLAAISMWNMPFILLSLLPFPIRGTRTYKIMLKSMFYLLNLPAIGLALIDLEYFKFTLTRSKSDLIDMAGYGEDMQQLIPVFLRDFWYIILLGIVLIVVLEWAYRKTNMKLEEEWFSFRYLGIQSGIMVVVMGVAVLAARGGFQPKPLSPIDASNYTHRQNVPAVLNTPFTMLTSFFKQGVEPVAYFKEGEAERIVRPIKYYPENELKSPPPNVVILMLESFSREYIGGYESGEIHTPFLDSLMQQSLVFDVAYANGKTSIESVPSITASMPSVMDAPLISSVYSDNRLTTLPYLLKELDYNSVFYHGATNGSMRFDGFAASAEFDGYYGRTEYDNDADFDGQWGIWDEEFLQYFAEGLDESSKPFFGVCFTMTSHQPFAIPERYQDTFPEGETPILKAVSYTDYAVKRFFKKASQYDWYENTLFVITADHTGPYYKGKYSNSRGQLMIPLLLHRPHSAMVGRDDTTLVQQIDIMPTIMDYIGYNKPFFSFGASVFEAIDHPRYNITVRNGIYQIMSNDHVVQFDGEKATAFYRLTDDPIVRFNLLEAAYTDRVTAEDEAQKEAMIHYLKAFIEVYNNRMINNHLIYQNDEG